MTNRTTYYLIALITLGVLVRIVSALSLNPVGYVDTNGYLDLAHSIQSLNFLAPTLRTPGYSLFLIFCGCDFNVVWLWQSLLGIITSICLFFIVHRLTNSNAASFSTGVLYSLSLNQVVFEAAMLTETLASALTALIFLTLLSRNPTGSAPVGVDAWLGLQTALLTLVQPRLAIIGLVCGMFLLVGHAQVRLRQRIGHFSAFAAGALPPLLLWCCVNYFASGYFGLASAGSLTIATHSVSFIEHAAPAYKDIVNIVVPWREKLRKQYEEAVPFAIMNARADLLAAHQGSLKALSSRLTAMSIDLYSRYPDKFLASVSKAWIDFWSPVRIAHEGFFTTRMKEPALAPLLVKLWSIQDSVWSIAYFAFAIATLAAILETVCKRADHVTKYVLLVAWTLVLGSTTQAILTLGDNGRYSMPYQGLILTAIASYGWSRVSALSKKRRQDLAAHKACTVVES